MNTATSRRNGRRRKRKTYFEKHARAFAVIGCIIGLLTFVVKEVSQDTVRKLQDSVSAARLVEESGEKDDNTLVGQVQVQMRLNQISDSLNTFKNTQALPGANLQSEAAEAEILLSNAEERLNRVSEMLDKLSIHGGPLAAKQIELKNEFSLLEKDANDTIAKCLSKKDHDVVYDVIVLFQAVRVLVFDLEIIPTQEAVVKTAKAIEQRCQSLVDLCTDGFWILSLLGWGLAITGACYGFKGSKE